MDRFEGEKRCPKCGNSKSISSFHRDSRRKDGCQTKCKSCAGAHRSANADRIKAARATYYAGNREAHLKRSAANYAENTDRIRATQSAWHRENAGKVAVRKAKYRLENPEKFRGKRAGDVGYLGYLAQWRRLNQGKTTAASNKRRALKLRATPAWANFDVIREIYEVAAAATEIFEIPFEVDHIIPLNSKFVCGLHCESNLRVISKSENRKKKNSVWPDMP